MKALLIDVTRCTGCERCVAACVAANGLDPRRADHDKAMISDGLSANRLTTVRQLASDRFARVACMHCQEPSCVAACLVGGLRRLENGAVVYDEEKCIGCRYCMLACPFHIPRYEWSETVPFMKKCELCDGLRGAQEVPACFEACPEEAIRYGEREELLALAKRRIAEHPGRYIDHVWGEQEFGGTGVLYLSDIDLHELGWPRRESASIPELTHGVVQATPVIAGSVLASVAGINWIVRRRMQRLQGHSETGETTAGEERR